MSAKESKKASSISSRVYFDDESQLESPKCSLHWQNLVHHPERDKLLNNLDELKTFFRNSLFRHDEKEDLLAIWSCVAGYCEALATHRDKRYCIFPLPIDALCRLVKEEFQSFLSNLSITPTNSTENHRDIVRTISNAVWAKAIAKPNIRDEMHANSLYVCLRGQIDKKTLDCFGASVVTIAALNMIGNKVSTLCLSEDHAYERHITNTTNNSFGTCEVAIPGNTKLARSKRAREIAATFEDKPKSESYLTPQTSWLYMASNAVICNTIEMALVAIMANINCTIEKKKRYFLGSGQLYDLKRDLLWILHDEGHMKKFPFGLLELGDCEEHRGSSRSSEWVTVEDLDEPILVNEQLFRDAIQINLDFYNEAQVYPYYYAGHYHKDAGNMSTDQEYRLIEAVKMYAQATRVTSKYPYEPGAIQLNKHASIAALLIFEDILTTSNQNNNYNIINDNNNEYRQPREWATKSNAIGCCIWLLVLFDSLLYWEEQQQQRQQYSNNNQQHFVEILKPYHPYSMSKLLACFPECIRAQAIQNLISAKDCPSTEISITNQNNESSQEIENKEGTYQPKLRSKRMGCSNTLLITALKKPKVVIREMDLSIIFEEDESGRRSKRARRCK